VERQFVSLRIDPPAQPLGHGGDGRGHTPDHRLGVERADPRGASICRMFNQIIAGQSLPRHLSSDHDPLFRFHRWLANLRILEVEEIREYREPANDRVSD
jgi:hypothetical protein